MTAYFLAQRTPTGILCSILHDDHVPENVRKVCVSVIALDEATASLGLAELERRYRASGSLAESPVITAAVAQSGTADCLTQAETVTDEMCRAALNADSGRRFQGFASRIGPEKFGAPHYIRDMKLPPGQQVIWEGESGDKMMERIAIEVMRISIAAALAAAPEHVAMQRAAE